MRFFGLLLWVSVLAAQGPDDQILKDAIAAHQAGNIDAAIGGYERFLKVYPDTLIALSNLGAAYASTDRLPEAVEAYRRALVLAPNDPDIHENLAQALAQLGRVAEAQGEHLAAERLRSAP